MSSGQFTPQPKLTVHNNRTFLRMRVGKTFFTGEPRQVLDVKLDILPYPGDFPIIPEVGDALNDVDALLHSVKAVDTTKVPDAVGPVDFENKSSPPPSVYVFEFLLPTSVSKDFVANLEDIYLERWVPLYGVRKANWLWFWQNTLMVVRYWGGIAIEFMKLMPKT